MSTATMLAEKPEYRPSEDEEFMNERQLEYFKQKLLSWRESLIEESRETIDHLKEENWHESDIADRASLETEAGVELRTRNRYLKLISKIDSAIRRHNGVSIRAGQMLLTVTRGASSSDSVFE